ncbi:MAG: hypothetical protein F7B95_04425, partial [Desulfurococcales archaeon]|nr:hypothetical protein [Desulfurococcales archaeon]
LLRLPLTTITICVIILAVLSLATLPVRGSNQTGYDEFHTRGLLVSIDVDSDTLTYKVLLAPRAPLALGNAVFVFDGGNWSLIRDTPLAGTLVGKIVEDLLANTSLDHTLVVGIHGDNVTIEYRVDGILEYITGHRELYLEFMNLGATSRKCIKYTSLNAFDLLDLVPASLKEALQGELEELRIVVSGARANTSELIGSVKVADKGIVSAPTQGSLVILYRNTYTDEAYACIEHRLLYELLGIPRLVAALVATHPQRVVNGTGLLQFEVEYVPVTNITIKYRLPEHIRLLLPQDAEVYYGEDTIVAVDRHWRAKYIITGRSRLLLTPLEPSSPNRKFAVVLNVQFTRPGKYYLGEAVFHYCIPGWRCTTIDIPVYNLHENADYVTVRPPKGGPEPNQAGYTLPILATLVAAVAVLLALLLVRVRLKRQGVDS